MYWNKPPILLTLVLIVAYLSFFALPIFAAKPRVSRSTAGGGGYVGGSYSSAKLSRSTNSIVVTFFNLGNVSKISYTLSYTANGIAQGVVGSIVPKGPTDQRDLYFGTCSKGVCTPHYNITNARLTITTILKSGSRNVKLYRIKY